MVVNHKSPISAFLLILACSSALADTGKIKVCRDKVIVSSSDNKDIKFPPLDYVGACDKNGENCRAITISADGGSVGKATSSCAILNASTKRTDGKPIRVGTVLRPSYSETDDFVNKGFDHYSESFVGNAHVTVVTDFK